MCNCKMCNWLKGLFGKKNCCEEKKVEETVTPVAPVTPTEEPVIPASEEKTEEQAQ